MINWPEAILLFVISLPGIFVAIPRVIAMLLIQIEKPIQRRVTLLVKIQTIIMVFVMSVTGAALSIKTGLKAPIIEALIQGKPIGHLLIQHSFAVFMITLFTIVIFFIGYYRVFMPRLQQNTVNAMKLLRIGLGLDGTVLYGGIVEEVVSRWGFMNLIIYFAALFAGGLTNFTIYLGMILSSLFFSLGHIPMYFAAGCEKTRFFAFSLMTLNLIPAMAFAYIFWQYGLAYAMIAHSCFHIIWWYYDR